MAIKRENMSRLKPKNRGEESTPKMEEVFRPPQKLVKLSVRIDSDLHRRLKVALAANEESAQEMLERAIINYINESTT